MMEQCDLSERRRAVLWGSPATAIATRPRPDQMTKDISGKIVEIAQARRRFGYRRIHDMLREFPGVNHKRVYRCTAKPTWRCASARRSRRPRLSACRCRRPKRQ
jgi:putative transposase